MGITPLVYLRIKSEIDKNSEYVLEADRQTFSVKLPLSDNTKRKTFYFDQTFDCNASFELIQKEAVDPLLIQWLDGYNVSILTCGLSDSGKSHLLHGPKNPKKSSGILETISSNLFTLLDKKVSDYGHTYGGYRVGIQSFEIYAEMGRDLLDPVRDGLDYCESEIYGPSLNGISTIWVNDANDLNQKMLQARNNRVGENTDTSETSVVFTVLVLARQEFSGRKLIKGGEVISKMVLVDQCAAEMYLKDSKKIVFKEGLFVGKTILGFWDALQNSSSVNSSILDDSSSIIQKLLEEEFGGNSIVAYFFCINPGDDISDNFALLNIVEIVREVVNFPIRNDENFLNFQRRIKNTLRLDYEKKLDHLRQQCANVDHKRNQLKITHKGVEKGQYDYEKLLCRFDDLNFKFNNILNIKSNIETSLVSLDRENLQLQKSLMDSKMVQNKALEESENRCLDLTNKIIALESEIVKVEMKSETIAKENGDLKSSIGITHEELQKAKDELAIVRNNYESIRKSYKKLVSSSEEMGLELVGLLNSKANFVMEREKLLSESEKLAKHNQFLESKLKSYDSIIMEKGSQLSKLQRQKEDLEATLAKNTFIINQQEKERIIHDAVLKTSKEESDKNMNQKLDQEYAHKISTIETEKKKMEIELQKLSSSETKLKKEISILESKTRESKVKEARLNSQISELENKIKDLNQKYRVNLESCIQKVFKLSEKSQLDKLSLKTLKAHIDEIISHINNSIDETKTTDNSKTYSQMESQLQNYIQSTQLEFEKERSALLKRCLIAEKKLEALSNIS